MWDMPRDGNFIASRQRQSLSCQHLKRRFRRREEPIRRLLLCWPVLVTTTVGYGDSAAKSRAIAYVALQACSESYATRAGEGARWPSPGTVSRAPRTRRNAR